MYVHYGLGCQLLGRLRLGRGRPDERRKNSPLVRLSRALRHILCVVGYFEVLAFSEGANLSGDPSDWVLSRAESAARERCDYLTEASS